VTWQGGGNRRPAAGPAARSRPAAPLPAHRERRLEWGSVAGNVRPARILPPASRAAGEGL